MIFWNETFEIEIERVIFKSPPISMVNFSKSEYNKLFVLCEKKWKDVIATVMMYLGKNGAPSPVNNPTDWD